MSDTTSETGLTREFAIEQATRRAADAYTSSVAAFEESDPAHAMLKIADAQVEATLAQAWATLATTLPGRGPGGYERC